MRDIYGDKSNFEKIMDRVCLEFVKAAILVGLGYLWAVKSYGIFG